MALPIENIKNASQEIQESTFSDAINHLIKVSGDTKNDPLAILNEGAFPLLELVVLENADLKIENEALRQKNAELEQENARLKERLIQPVLSDTPLNVFDQQH